MAPGAQSGVPKVTTVGTGRHASGSPRRNDLKLNRLTRASGIQGPTFDDPARHSLDQALQCTLPLPRWASGCHASKMASGCIYRTTMLNTMQTLLILSASRV